MTIDVIVTRFISGWNRRNHRQSF